MKFVNSEIAHVSNIVPAPTVNYPTVIGAQPQNQDIQKKSPVYPIARLQLERIKIDIGIWREAIKKAENPWTPFRVDMQRIFQDTILNEHLDACLAKRRNLTLMRKFKLCDDAGNEDENATKILNKQWFKMFLAFALDSRFFGYNLIKLGDIVDDAFKNISFEKRENVSPDRFTVGRMPYTLNGQGFYEAPFVDWWIYVKTPTETGASPCGYGILYKLAKTEILLRNNASQNADYNEVFGQPIRVGKTTKQDEERDEFEAALRDMGANAYMILDDGQDTLDMVGDQSGGRGFMTYSEFEKRGEQKISKVLLGHADALDSIPGRLGSSQKGNNNNSPQQQALADIQSEDGQFLEPIINEELLPRMIKLGFKIPLGLHFEFLNDEEQEEFRKKEDESNKITADIAAAMVTANLQMDAKYFEERTGIPTKEIQQPQPPPPLGQGMPGKPQKEDQGQLEAQPKPPEKQFGQKPQIPAPQKEKLKNMLMDWIQGLDYEMADDVEPRKILDYNPDEARVPAGQKGGGQWSGGNGGGNITEGEHRGWGNDNIHPMLLPHFRDAHEMVKTNGGFSHTPQDKSFIIKEPYIVALSGYEKQIPFNKFTPTSISNYFMKYNQMFVKDRNLILGGWYNKENGNVYLDLSKGFNDKGEAISFGKKHNQLKGWDSTKQEEFDIMSKTIKNKLSGFYQARKLRAMFTNMSFNVPLDKDYGTEKAKPKNVLTSYKGMQFDSVIEYREFKELAEVGNVLMDDKLLISSEHEVYVNRNGVAITILGKNCVQREGGEIIFRRGTRFKIIDASEKAGKLSLTIEET